MYWAQIGALLTKQDLLLNTVHKKQFKHHVIYMPTFLHFLLQNTKSQLVFIIFITENTQSFPQSSISPTSEKYSVSIV